MKSLDGKKEWIETYCFKPKNRVNLYHKITSYIDDKDEHLCMISKKITNRIGSGSQNGEVFIGSINNNEFAIKVLPIINKNSYIQNKNELNIAELASQLVLENRSIHFPIVYEFDLCENTIFYNDTFTMKSEKFQKGETKSNVLIMELGCCDLKQYLKYNKVSQWELSYIKKQCEKAIYDMHSLIGVCHNDLHLGNFLLLPYDNEYGYIIMIHDFGSADFRTTYQNLDYEFLELELLEQF